MSKRSIAAALLPDAKKQLFERNTSCSRDTHTNCGSSSVEALPMALPFPFPITSESLSEIVDALTRHIPGEDYLERERSSSDIILRLRAFALFLLSDESRDTVLLLQTTERTLNDAINHSICKFSAREEKREQETKEATEIDLR
jgi:hypothetical protein